MSKFVHQHIENPMSKTINLHIGYICIHPNKLSFGEKSLLFAAAALFFSLGTSVLRRIKIID